jgi:hypothetical protein
MFDVTLRMVEQFGGYAVLTVLLLYMYGKLVSRIITVVENNTKALTIVGERLSSLENRMARVEDRLDLKSESGIMSTENEAAVPQKEGWDG